MYYLISIIGLVLFCNDNYREWSKNIKQTLIFNVLRNFICEGEVVIGKEEEDIKPTKTTSNKELDIWNNKDNKTYSLIFISISEEVRFHIVSIINPYGALKKL